MDREYCLQLSLPESSGCPLSKIIKLFLFTALVSVLLPLNAEELPATSPTGILIDRVLPMSHLETLDGTPESSPLTSARWRQSVFELQQSAEADLGWPAPRTLLRPDAAKDVVNLAVLHARYDRLDAERVMHSEEVFAFAPVRARNYNGQDLRFTLRPENILQHASGTITALSFDAGDGLGFRPLQSGEMLQVSYSSTGVKILRLRASLSDGRSLHSNSQLEVVQLLTPDPTETWQITASETWDGIAGTGQAYIYLADGHTQLTNPVLVVEGFDIDNTIDWPVLYDLLNQENLLEDLRSAGYDAVVLDFTEAVDPIQRNAFVLTELLERVNAEKPPGQSTVLIGASMGGLVARYGLLWLEQQNTSHGVRTYLSFDSPHNGANIPLGIQEWVSFFSDESEEAAFLADRLNAPASRQMLLYHLENTVGTTAGPDPAMAALNAEFLAMGDWPQTSRRVSIANGSGSMTNQGFNAGEQIIVYEYRSILADIDGNVWAVPEGGNQVIFDGLIDPLIGSTSSAEISISGTLPWDNSPGGSRNSMQQVADANAPFGDIVALHNSHNFIPTISALALPGFDPFHDIAGDGDLLNNTEFDQVYFPSENQEHIEINAQNKTWLLAEIQAGIVVSSISGDTSEDGVTATFTIAANTAPSAPVTISLSSSNPDEGTVPVSVVLPAGTTAAQEVTVTGVDDVNPDGSVMYSIITGVSSSADNLYDGINPADIAVVNTDNETDEIFKDGFES